jgi:hypothetical protein
MQHLPGLSRIALGNRHLRAALAVGIGQDLDTSARLAAAERTRCE